MNRFYTLLSDVITEGFPELKHLNIYIKVANPKNSWMQMIHEVVFEINFKLKIFKKHHYRIVINKKLENCNDEILKGGIAHELCHLVKPSGLFYLTTGDIFYRMEEKEIDKEVIRRGFEKELIEFNKYTQRF